MIKIINSLFVTMFGIGKLPKIPGSYASLVTVIFLYILFHIFLVSAEVFLFFLVAIFIISLFAINLFVKDLTNKDPKEVVVDEFIGQSIPIYLYEIAHGTSKEPQESILFYLYIFILFRYFDIKKPFPVSFFDKKFKNSFGVIIDDVVAGLCVVLTLIIFMVVKSKLF